MIPVSSREEIETKYGHLIKGRIAGFSNMMKFMRHCKRNKRKPWNSVTFYDKANEVMYVARSKWY